MLDNLIFLVVAIFVSFPLLSMIPCEEQEKISLKQLVSISNKGPVNTVCYTPQGDQLLIGGYNQPNSTIKIYDTALKKIKSELFIKKDGNIINKPFKKITCIKEIVAAANVNQLNIWDIVTTQNIIQFDGKDDSANTVSFNNDRTLLLAACDNAIARIYDIRCKKYVSELNASRSGEPQKIMDAQWNPKDNFEIVTSYVQDNKIQFWDFRIGKNNISTAQKENLYQSAQNYFLTYHPSGDYLVSSGSEKLLFHSKFETIKRWSSGKIVAESDTAEPFTTVNSIAFCPNNSDILIAGLNNAHITLCNLKDPSQSESIYTNKSLVALAIHPSGKLLASGSFSCMDATIWEINMPVEDNTFSENQCMEENHVSRSRWCNLY